MKFEKCWKKSGQFEVEPRGDAIDLVRAIQQNFPQRSLAIDHLSDLLAEKQGQLIYKRLPTMTSILDFVRDKRALLDENGEFRIGGEIPDYLQRYLKRINSGMLLPCDVVATVNQAFFILVHPAWRGSRWVSVGHHNFTTYRGDAYGPGWLEPRYWIFGNTPCGFDIGFKVAAGYDPEEVLRRHCPEGGGSSKVTQMILGSDRLSFSIDDQQGYYNIVYVPVHIADGVWQRGWEVFGVAGGVLLNEIEASRKDCRY